MGLLRGPQAWRILREMDVQAIRRESERSFVLLVVGETRGEAARVAGLLSSDPDGGHHPWVLARAAAEPTEGEGLRADLVIAVTRTAEVAPDLARTAGAAATAGVPVLTIVWGASGTATGLVRRGEAARVAVDTLEPEAMPAIAVAVLGAVEADLRLALARQLKALRPAFFDATIDETAKANAIYAFTSGVAEMVPVANVPLNLADMVILTKNQLVMGYRLALAAGKKGTARHLLGEVLTVIGGGFLLRQGARQLVGLIPVAGVLPKVAVAYAGTWAIGRTVAAWAGEGRRLSPGGLAGAYTEARTRGRAFASSLVSGAGSRPFLALRKRKQRAEGAAEGALSATRR